MTMTTVSALIAALIMLLTPQAWAARQSSIAIVGATVIDGNGGPSIADTTIIVEGQRITALGPRDSVKIPKGARIVDGEGKFVTPGFVDVNVHVTGSGFMEELFPLLLYGEKNPILKYGHALEAAQMALKFGVTTLRDTYGPLPPLLELRDSIARREVIGPRLQVAGDILGWGGPHHNKVGGGSYQLEPMQERWNDYFHAYAPVGVELTTMYPDEARAALNTYLDKGPDFIKIGVTSHSYIPPVSLTFSPRVLEALVEEAHKRGIKVDVHSSTAEGHLMAAEAGVDVITHAEAGAREFSDEVVATLRDRKVICAIFGGMVAGPVADFIESSQQPKPVDGTRFEQAAKALWPFRNSTPRLPTSSEALRRAKLGGFQSWDLDVRRENAKKLIQGGCTIAVGTDASPSRLPEIAGAAPMYFPDPGVGTIIAIEALVRLGMTAGEAIVAATKHGAMAAGKLDQLGTLESGKLADLLILRGDPLADISNIRQLDMVMIGGELISPATLPTYPRYYHR